MRPTSIPLRLTPPTMSIAEWPDAEILLLRALRSWLAGYETGDVACLELAWQIVSTAVPLNGAKRIVAELGHFTRVLRGTLACRYSYLPHCCRRITEQERLTLELIARAQEGDLGAGSRLAQGLCASPRTGDLVEAAADLGAALAEAAMTLSFTRRPSEESAPRLH